MPEVAGHELPGPVDRLALEVVAEAPVAEHLEEGVMARRPPDLLEVVVLAGHAQAALEVDGAGVAALFGAGQRVLEGDHPAVHEEQRVVVRRHEAGAGHDAMAALREELDELAPDVRGGPPRDPRITLLNGARHRRNGSRAGPALRVRASGSGLCLGRWKVDEPRLADLATGARVGAVAADVATGDQHPIVRQERERHPADRSE